MQFRLDVIESTPPGWIAAVLADFDSFLQDHANCERKVSSMALSFVAKYPDRTEIINDLIETGIEELEHFRDVYKVMAARGIKLVHEIDKDIYMEQLLGACRNGRDERFIDRLVIASIVECRGAERFKIVYENLHDDLSLKEFYHRLWASEAKHSETYIQMALKYFDEKSVYKRVHELNEIESKIMLNLPFRAALH
jgi:tRNA 2-(methylsulfanyl)-N6-isopentenyladenosine37 hydroxylase